MDNILDTIRDKAEEILAKVKGDEDTLSKFKANPIETVKGLLGKIDIPEDALEKIVEFIKAKLDDGDDTNNSITDKIGGLLDKVTDLFDKKDN